MGKLPDVYTVVLWLVPGLLMFFSSLFVSFFIEKMFQIFYCKESFVFYVTNIFLFVNQQWSFTWFYNFLSLVSLSSNEFFT